ncbi:hypothetical protein PVAP13_7KG369955 [Panicum virgatum]|uniref:Aldose 1-epimerase n=1 Tax=Panicum virgatum TaxID=38727 RepID=A0A8T0QHA9_PANVG|nr:hypothetical protein PVAP13_7KG369955 [Panicum virgatum]
MARGELFLALLFVVVASALAANAAGARKTVDVYELKKGNFSVKVTNWGATIMSVILPDSRGNLADIVLGLDTVGEYIVMGGRVAGYDANYVVDGEPWCMMRPVAAVRDGASGRALELWGNQPCVQLYTANWLNRTRGEAGAVYGRHAGFCLETQGYPDALKHPEFPSQTLRRGQVYRHDMLFKLSF